MGYYIRYFVERDLPPSSEEFARLFVGTGATFLEGEIVAEGRVCGAVEVSTPSDELFLSEIEEFREFLEDVSMSPGKRRVMDCLEHCRAIVAVQVLFGTGESDSTLRLIDPLWNWLNANRAGLLQADGEGFYDGKELIVELA